MLVGTMKKPSLFCGLSFENPLGDSRPRFVCRLLPATYGQPSSKGGSTLVVSTCCSWAIHSKIDVKFCSQRLSSLSIVNRANLATWSMVFLSIVIQRFGYRFVRVLKSWDKRNELSWQAARTAQEFFLGVICRRASVCWLSTMVLPAQALR